MSTFPTLQGEATNGKPKVWSVRVVERDGNGMIETSHGYLGGKIQISEKVITVGKNIGKKNETTPVQQAISEAHAAWTKKKESGYNEPAAAAPSNDEPSGLLTKSMVSRSKGIDAAVPSPMLAHEYQKRGKTFAFPCYTQPKLDGTRCIAVQGKGLFSRLKKSFPHMEHIMEEVNRIPSVGTLILDGELYSDELTFQEIVGLVKRETLKPGDAEKQRKIKFHVYDIIKPTDYEDRLEHLRRMFYANHNILNHVVIVSTNLCRSEEEMKKQHAEHVANGYEGIMLRNPMGLYKHSRSVDLLKYKEFFDAEYNVVGFKEGEGLEAGCVIWNCCNADGKEFHCRPRGSREERMELFQQGAAYIGKMLTVRFQELTDEGLPRFPVGIAFRDYE
jgi:ATP-dependent DNA ligase